MIAMKRMYFLTCLFSSKCMFTWSLCQLCWSEEGICSQIDFLHGVEFAWNMFTNNLLSD
ncbi:hypothetical protein KP509_05G074200 [Ceratopteris richardii]|uniref:Uncharacterized protein n=1 Tax=Ceratopteris richardii TaxID=49495 RepID=A0A8T2UU93_CERRI|nr:hypothetical protein KP509_05G074200 [Ceratopteris richardii]KAH7437477.1 hypothetical protein KP509_05G074200 [Ceratopteris richardii]